MSVTTTISRVQSTGDGTTTSFSCAFPFASPQDVKVWVDGELKALTTDYTLSYTYARVNNVAEGLVVTFNEAPANAAEITIERSTAITNPTKLFEKDEFSLKAIEEAYDRITMIVQEIKDRLDRSHTTEIGNIDPPGDSPVPYTRLATVAVVISSNGAGTYDLAAVSPHVTEGQDGYQTGLGGSLRFSGAEINGRTDVTPGDIVIAHPFEDSASGTAWRFFTTANCVGGQTFNYEFTPLHPDLPSFVVSRNQLVHPSQVVTLDEVNFPIQAAVDGVTLVPLHNYIDYLSTQAFIDQIVDPDVTQPYKAVSLDDRTVFYYTGLNPRTPSNSDNWLGTCWTWKKVLKDPTPTFTDTMPNPLEASAPYIGGSDQVGGEYLFHDSNADTGFAQTGSQTSESPFYISAIECQGERIYKAKDTPGDVDPNPDPDPTDCDENPEHPDCEGGDDSNDPPDDTWVQYRACSNGQLVDLYRPEVLGGEQTGIDFTKILNYLSPLLGTDPATACTDNGTDPGAITVSGLTGPLAAQNGSIAFFSRGVTATAAGWTWRNYVSGTDYWTVYLAYAVADHTYPVAGTNHAIKAGEWYVYTAGAEGASNVSYFQKTAGFGCDGTVPEGVHTFTTDPALENGTASAKPTVQIGSFTGICIEASSIKVNIPGTIADPNLIESETEDCDSCLGTTPTVDCSGGPETGADIDAVALQTNFEVGDTVSGSGVLVNAATFTGTVNAASSWRYCDKTLGCQWQPADDADTGTSSGVFYNASGHGGEFVYILSDSVSTQNKVYWNSTFSVWEVYVIVGVGPTATTGVRFFKEGGNTPLGRYTQNASYGTVNMAADKYIDVVEANCTNTTTTLCDNTTGVNSNGDEFIARTDNSATAKSKFEAAWTAGKDIFFDMDGVWNLDLDVTWKAINDGSKISWYDSGGGTNRPIIRHTDDSDLPAALRIVIDGNRDGLTICGIEFDGRSDGANINLYGSEHDQRILLHFYRGGGYNDDKNVDTMDNVVISDLYMHHGDNLIQFDDQIAQQLYLREDVSRVGGLGFIKGCIVQYCRFSHAVGPGSHSIAISVSGVRADNDLEIANNVFYKIGFDRERNTTPSREQQAKPSSDSNYDPNQREHGIYGRDAGCMNVNIHHNVFSDCAATAAQMRSGGSFDNNVVIRTPMMVLIGHTGTVKNNVFIDPPMINPEKWPGGVTNGLNISGPILVEGNKYGRQDNPSTQPVINVWGNETNVKDNKVVGYNGSNAQCRDEGIKTRIYWGSCATAAAIEAGIVNGNEVVDGAAADAINAAIPTTYDRTWIENNLLNRAFGTWTLGTHDSDTLWGPIADAF